MSEPKPEQIKAELDRVAEKIGRPTTELETVYKQNLDSGMSAFAALAMTKTKYSYQLSQIGKVKEGILGRIIGMDGPRERTMKDGRTALIEELAILAKIDGNYITGKMTAWDDERKVFENVVFGELYKFSTSIYVDKYDITNFRKLENLNFEPIEDATFPTLKQIGNEIVSNGKFAELKDLEQHVKTYKAVFVHGVITDHVATRDGQIYGIRISDNSVDTAIVCTAGPKIVPLIELPLASHVALYGNPYIHKMSGNVRFATRGIVML